MKKKTHYKLLLVPLGMYGLMAAIAIFWCLAQLLHLTKQIWLDIGVATGILFIMLSFIAPIVGLITGIISLMLKRKYDVAVLASMSAKPQEAAKQERKAERSYRAAAVLNLVLGIVCVGLSVFWVLLIRSL